MTPTIVENTEKKGIKLYLLRESILKFKNAFGLATLFL